MSFVHLHRHSEYSVLDGMGSAEEYAERAEKLGQWALAQTDHGNLCGALEHIAACEKHGLHPIVGMEAYFRPDRTNHDPKQFRAKNPTHMILFASGLQGYRSLMSISSKAYLDESFYYRPCVDYALLEEDKEGLLCTTSCINSYLSQSIVNEDDKGAYEHVERLQSIFKDNLYIEIMPHDFEDQRVVNPLLMATANRYGIPVIATVDAHYVLPEHADTASILFKMNMKETLKTSDAKRERGETVYGECPTLYLMEEHEVRDLFAKNHPSIDVDSAIKNTSYLASQIQPFTLNKGLKLPRIKGKKSAEEVLREWCNEGLERIGESYNKIYIDRMEYELSVLKGKDVLDYFVIVGDIVRWAKDQGMRIAPGRGSAAGCLVSYLIKITTVDPIAYGLLFERFLNPDRKGMPDIDVDFPADLIDVVKQRFADVHGEKNVSNVISHQTFKAKGAIQGIARVYDIPYDEVMSATKRIDDKMDLDEALQVTEVQAFAQKHPEVIKHAQRLEGSIKATSKHAAAVVVTERPVTEYMPTMRARSTSPTVTAYSDKPSSPIISEYGILKIDFLSTTDLAVQQMALELIEKRRGIKLDLDALPAMRDPTAVDKATMKLFQDGHTFGLFQFGGSHGITGMLKKMQPQTINDLAACNALYRPGPLDGGVADDYISKVGHPELVTYWHSAVEPFLSRSNGIMIYQEQLMQVCQAIGDFSPGQADDMRKATGKLYRLGKEEAKEFMGQFKGQWDKGSANKIASQAAEEIWDKILAFGGYSFNASHSVSYSLEAYQGGYLKANYPDEFYTAIMAKDPDKIAQAVREATARGIKLIPPDINTSDSGMSLTDQGIKSGLSSILGVGDIGVQEILSQRPFTSYQDFYDRVNKRRCNATVRRGLLESGALEILNDPRVDAAWSYMELLDASCKNKLQRKSLGFIAGDPKITKYMELFKRAINLDTIERSVSGDQIIVGGEIVEIKEKHDKKGNLMCWVSLAFGADIWRVTVFASMYPTYAQKIELGNLVIARARLDDRGGMTLQYLMTAEEFERM